jgi:hypothetical protein
VKYFEGFRREFFEGQRIDREETIGHVLGRGGETLAPKLVIGHNAASLSLKIADIVGLVKAPEEGWKREQPTD